MKKRQKQHKQRKRRRTFFFFVMTAFFILLTLCMIDSGATAMLCGVLCPLFQAPLYFPPEFQVLSEGFENPGGKVI